MQAAPLGQRGTHPKTAVTSVRARCPSYDRAVLSTHAWVGTEGWGGDVAYFSPGRLALGIGYFYK